MIMNLFRRREERTYRFSYVMERANIDVKDDLREQLIMATDFSTIKSILLKMKVLDMDIEKVIKTTVYRKLVVENKDHYGFYEIKKLINNENISSNLKSNSGRHNDTALELAPSSDELRIVQKNGNNIRYIPNPTIEVQMAAVKQKGNSIRYINNPSIEVQIAAIKQKSSSVRYISNPSVEVQKIAVNRNPSSIKYISNPSLEIKDIAIERDGNAIKYIEYPSIEIQKKAVERNWESIKFIKNPTIEIQLKCIEKDWNAIELIENPSIDVVIKAINQNVMAIKHIINPSDEAQIVAIEKDWRAIRFIKNPSLKAMKKAVNINGLSIQYIKNPPVEIQSLAVENNSDSIRFINNPSEVIELKAISKKPDSIQFIRSPRRRVILEAIKKDAFVIRFFGNLPLDLQLEAVKCSGEAIKFIKEPSEEVQLEAVKSSDNSIQFIKDPSPKVQVESVRFYPDSINFINNPCKEALVEYDNQRKIKQDYNEKEKLEEKYDELLNNKIENKYYSGIVSEDYPINKLINYLCREIGVKNIYIASGFVFKSGLELIEPSFDIALDNEGEVKIIIGSLQKYRNLVLNNVTKINGMDKDTAVYINNLINNKGLRMSTYEKRFFHGKFYLLNGEKKSCLIIGSSNLSNSGFNLNRELNIIKIIENDSDFIDEYFNWFNLLWDDCYEVKELDSNYFYDYEVENDAIGYSKIIKRDSSYIESELKELSDEEVKKRLRMWLSKEPDNIYSDLNIESLKDYILFEYKDFNLIILESFEHGNSYYHFNNYEVDSLLEEIRTLSKTEIFNLSEMNKRGYHISNHENLEIAINSLFVKQYRKK